MASAGRDMQTRVPRGARGEKREAGESAMVPPVAVGVAVERRGGRYGERRWVASGARRLPPQISRNYLLLLHVSTFCSTDRYGHNPGAAAAAAAVVVRIRHRHDRRFLFLLRPKKKVSWTEGTVVNGFLGRKSSKKCGIFHKEVPFDDHCSDDEADAAACSSSSHGHGHTYH